MVGDHIQVGDQADSHHTVLSVLLSPGLQPGCAQDVTVHSFSPGHPHGCAVGELLQVGDQAESHHPVLPVLQPPGHQPGCAQVGTDHSLSHGQPIGCVVGEDILPIPILPPISPAPPSSPTLSNCSFGFWAFKHLIYMK